MDLGPQPPDTLLAAGARVPPLCAQFNLALLEWPNTVLILSLKLEVVSKDCFFFPLLLGLLLRNNS